ncbi:MAG: hypothetical protein M9905_16980 [Rhizobiaceae bacterium]|nr:hypothetical protein [Rhizobiaceae bacterium]
MSFAGTSARAATAGAIAVLMAGCMSTPEPENRARSTVETAPADLQLLCASEVARSKGVSGDKVLPISSRRLDGGRWEVNVDAAGSQAVCVIDDDGNVTL